MICSTCGTENPAGKRFCGDCGSALAGACPSCGAVNPPDKKFCGDCGSSLAGATVSSADTDPPSRDPARQASAPAPVAERRLVSVLFADLVGFTTFSEGRDAEEVRETLTRYFTTAREVIELYGGRVEKFIGDAVMALWGAPTAREDDAERAVRAGLELVDAVRGLGPGIMARAGVLTGEAAVTIGATNEGMVAGDLVNTAARVQSAAPPGAVLVGAATMRAASAAITFEEAGEHALKGKADAVPTWRALRVVAQRGGHGRSDLPEPPFVGRDEELRQLKDLIALSARDPRARLVSVTGPGGIGKSRLAWEVEKYIDGIAESVYWHRGRSPSYGEGITFWALGEMVRRRAGLAEEDDAATTRRRIAATVDEYVSDESDRQWVGPALLALLGVEPAPSGGRDVLFAAWRIFFERIADRGPTVLLFEDLQWADSGLLDFVEYLLAWSKSSPLLVVVLARPELFEQRPDWAVAIRHHTRMALEPLSDAAMRELLAGFVPGLPEPAVAAILERADGIPLYAVETVRALVADGRLERIESGYRPLGDLGALTIPETLRSLIASRLDTLDRPDRSIVADAAVLGQSFTISGIAALSGLEAEEIEPRLRVLVRRELFDLEVDPRSPERGQYRFVQSLIREVAYGTLARRDRRARHLAAARFYESLGDDELAGALATHYVAAHGTSEPGAEADAVGIQARLALSGAADRAAGLGAHDQAVRYLRSAIAIATDSAERASLLIRAARSSNTGAHHGEAEVLVREAIDEAAAAGDARLLGGAQELLGEILIDTGNPPQAVTALEAALATPPDGLPDTVRAGLLGTYSRALMRAGRPADAVPAADLALDLAEHLGLDRIVAETFNNKGSSLAYLGRNREAIALLRAAVDVAREGGFVAAEARALSNLGVTEDDPRKTREWARQARELGLRVGNRSMANWATETTRFADYLLAEGWDQAVLPDGYGDDPGEQTSRSPLDEVRTCSITGLVRAARGEDVEATIERLETLATEVSDAFATSAVRMIRSELSLLSGEYARSTREALDAASDQNNSAAYLAMAVRGAIWGRDLAAAREAADRLDRDAATGTIVMADRLAARAGIAALEGRREEALAGYRESLARLRSAGADFSVARRAIDLVVALGPADETVREAIDEARVILERVGARAYLDRLDAALAGTAEIDARASSESHAAHPGI